MTQKPLVVLLTGISGSGKTTVVKHLQALGHHAVSLDGYPGLCSWTTLDGQPADRPDQPHLAWLENHIWSWNPGVLDELITQLRTIDTPIVWAAGIAGNTTALASRFDLRILLRIDKPTMRQRIQNPSRTNMFGTIGDSATYLDQMFHHSQEALAATCDHETDATATAEDVANAILNIARQTTHRVLAPGGQG